MFPIKEGASNFAEGVDQSFMIILWISLFFLITITIVMVYFVIRYNKKRHKVAVQYDGSVSLEIIWTVVPLILVLVMFYYGWKGFAPMRDVPDDAIQIKTISYMWDWEFEYENGKRSKDLYIPLNKAVKLNMISLDVIHSLYIPAFRIKEDVVPGRTNFVWFIPTMEGDFDVLCAEYCGLRHSFMDAKAYVLPKTEYETWLADFDPKELEVPKGLQIMKNNACTGCHSLDGSKLVGTSFKNLYGSEREVYTDGNLRKVKVDGDYIRIAILEPNKDVVKGYAPNVMQTYIKVLNDEEIQDIIDYFRQENEKKQ